MSTDEADGTLARRAWTTPSAPMRRSFEVCALKKLVEEEEDGGMFFGEVADLAEARDLGIEAGAALLEGVVDENACTYL